MKKQSSMYIKGYNEGYAKALEKMKPVTDFILKLEKHYKKLIKTFKGYEKTQVDKNRKN